MDYCPVCDREATTEFYGELYCEECAQSLSDEFVSVPLDRMSDDAREVRFGMDGIVRCWYG